MKWKGKIYKQVPESAGCDGCAFENEEHIGDGEGPCHNQNEGESCSSSSIIYKEIITYKKRKLTINN